MSWGGLQLRRNQLLEETEAVVSPVLANLGYDLVELGLVVSHGRRTLRVFIDKPGGVNLEDCAMASKVIGPLLDEHGVSMGRYFLEVSSPGAERKLRKREDFKRFVGRKALVRLREAMDGVNKIEGRIVSFSFEDDLLKLKPEDGDEKDVPFEAISSARLCL
jgi:ribosome maturation factor RimP